ncbi:MAG: hypothetical protein ACI9MC_003457 [Kiritimatiellia bacterium]|jgi:hypothetical protein
MHRYMLLAVPMFIACQGDVGIIDLSDPVEDEDVVDPAVYDNATFRIVQPASADFLPWGEEHTFQAELVSEAGEPLEFDEVTWTSGVDEAWHPSGMAFDDNKIDVGIHDITAQVILPNGDRQTHTIGGVIVQHELAGTYVGLFTSSMSFQNFPITCSGSAVVLVDAYGDAVDGDAKCIAGAGGFEIPMDFTIEAQNDDGELTGNATARIIAFDVDFDADGSLPGDETLDMSFSGDVLGSEMTGRIDTTRINRDAGL